MAEYIEKESLVYDMLMIAKYQIGERKQGILGCIETIRMRKAEDVAPVVRCKDCLWSYKVDCKEPKYACKNICRFGCAQWLDSNDFCSYGERSIVDDG